MPSPITKPVARVTRDEYRVLYAGAARAKAIVVTILPGDVLEFREKKGRMRWLLAIDTAFKYAVRLQALSKVAEKGRKTIERKRQVKRK